MSRSGGQHCAFCGKDFPPETPFPRDCPDCGGRTEIGLVTLVSVIARRGTELLAASEHPVHEGEGLFLPATFLEFGETWRQAAARVTGLEGRFRAAGAISDSQGIPRLYAAFEGEFEKPAERLCFAPPELIHDDLDREQLAD